MKGDVPCLRFFGLRRRFHFATTFTHPVHFETTSRPLNEVRWLLPEEHHMVCYSQETRTGATVAVPSRAISASRAGEVVKRFPWVHPDAPAAPTTAVPVTANPPGQFLCPFHPAGGGGGPAPGLHAGTRSAAPGIGCSSHAASTAAKNGAEGVLAVARVVEARSLAGSLLLRGWLNPCHEARVESWVFVTTRDVLPEIVEHAYLKHRQGRGMDPGGIWTTNIPPFLEGGRRNSASRTKGDVVAPFHV